MFKKVILALFVLFCVSNVSADNHYTLNTDDIQIDNYPTATVTLGEKGGTTTVEFTVTESPDVGDGRGSLELVLLAEDGTSLVANGEYKNIEGGRSYEVTFNGLQGDWLTTDHCGDNRMYMLVDDSDKNDYREHVKDEIFQGEDGEDGNIDDGRTDTFGSLTVEGGDCASINEAPNANFDYVQDQSDIGVSTKIFLDASGSSDSDGEIVDYRWEAEGISDFNSDDTAWVRWDSPGSKSISLTVEDDDGATQTHHKTIDVQETQYETEYAGRYMYYKMNPNSPSNYHWWYLTNVKWEVDGAVPDEAGSMVFMDSDTCNFCLGNENEKAVYRGNVGQIVGSTGISDQNSLEGLSSDPANDPYKKDGDASGSYCGDNNGRDDGCDMLRHEFNMYEDATYQGDPTPAKIDNADDLSTNLGYEPGLDSDYGMFQNDPNGQIALGHAPNIFDNKDMNGQVIFALCKGDQHSTTHESDGITIDMAPKKFNRDGSVDQSPDLYRCDSKWQDSSGWRGESGGVWRPVTECNDGIDNDGDGAIDHHEAEDRPSDTSADSDCSSPTDETGEARSSGDDGGGSDYTYCTPAVSYNGTHYVAYYGGAPDGSPEEYCDGSDGNEETFAEWSTSEGGTEDSPPAPEVYTCDESAFTEFGQLAGSYCEDRSYSSHDENTSQDSSQINYAVYYPTKDYLGDITNVEYYPDFYTYRGEKTESHFVNYNGWAKAYMALDDSSFSSGGTKPVYRKGAEYIYGPDSGDVHDETYWIGSSSTLGMVDGDGNGYTTGSYNDSWVVANAGAPNNDRISSEFAGGYAGKCPEGTKWKNMQSLGGWQCTGQPDWKQAVFLPEITEDSDTIGMMVMPYNLNGTNSEPFEIANLGLQSWKTAYDNVPDQSVSSDQNLDIMSVSCYPGETPPDYSSASEGVDYFNSTVDIPGTDINNPIGVYGEVNMAGSSTYTCQWDYTREDGQQVSGIGGVIELQKTESSIVGNFGDIRKHYFGSSTTDPKTFPSGTSLEEKKYTAEAFKTLVDVNREAEGLAALS